MTDLHPTHLPAQLFTRLQGGLVVSCQPLDDSPMDTPEIIVAMARAAMDGGATALRIEGAHHVRAVAQALPHAIIIGIVKRDLIDSAVRITPYIDDVHALAQAGAAIIAFDGTARPRPVSVDTLLAAVRAAGKAAMADCSTLKDGLACHALGCDLVGTTLSGYTEDTAYLPEDCPNTALIGQLAAHGVRVIAEGRIRTPGDAAACLRAGACCVTVGSAITRIEHITQWFTAALQSAPATSKA
ncbi:N-acetylmannosamine-6-phosphate 2-epimerase [Janthinobacterium sp. HLX7-2]|uniref:N-acetylmannosamine-6-phosphate 2-epimerase n=1 Tax=Janthinobacterium sp. HLX7-2 TaxID=1259331 RepID=UPI003F246169